MNINLTSEEIKLLCQILETYMGDLRVEIHHTHTSEFKDELHHEEAIVATLRHKLQTAKDATAQ